MPYSCWDRGNGGGQRHRDCSVPVGMKAFTRPLPETLILLAVGLADMVSTILLVGSGLCRELNPLMAPLLDHHWATFAGVKGLTLLAAAVGCEWYRRRDEAFVRRWVRVGILSYLALWVVWFATGWDPLGAV